MATLSLVGMFQFTEFYFDVVIKPKTLVSWRKQGDNNTSAQNKDDEWRIFLKGHK